MPYMKNRYVNGLRAMNDWTDTLRDSKDMNWSSVLKTADDLSYKSKMSTIANLDWTKQLTTNKDLTFTGTRYDYVSNYKPQVQNVAKINVFNKDNDSQVNSFFDAAAMSNNPNVKHSNILDKGMDWLNTLTMSKDKKEFYNKYKDATGKSPWGTFLDVRNVSPESGFNKAYETYKKMKNKEEPSLLDNILQQRQSQFNDLTLDTDENGEVKLKYNPKGFGGQYEDGSYEYKNLGEALLGDKVTGYFDRVGKSIKNFSNDAVQVMVDTVQPMVVNPSWESGLAVVNNVLTNMSETMDMAFFWKPIIQTDIDQYAAVKEPGEGFDPVKFFNVLWNKTPEQLAQRKQALARYYGLDTGSMGNVTEVYKDGRHQMDYSNVSEKLFNVNSNINVIQPITDLLEATGLVMNGYATMFNKDSQFGLGLGQSKFEINLGDLALEMIDPSFLTSGISESIMSMKNTKYIKTNAKAMAKETVDKMFKDANYKQLPYADRLQLYDYMENLIKKNANNLGDATSKDFLRNVRKQQELGNFLKPTEFKDTNVINNRVFNMMLDYNQKLGGYINPDMFQKQLAEAQKAISESIVRNNANKITTSILGGLTNLGYLTQAGPLEAIMAPVKIPFKTGAYALSEGVKWIGNKTGKELNVINKLEVVKETFYQTIRTQFGKEVAKAKEYTNQLKNINNVEVAENKYVTKKLQQIIKENAISFTTIDKAYMDLGLSPDQIVNVQNRLIAEEVMPNIIEVLKENKNPQEMLEDIMLVLKHCTDNEITDISDFVQVIKNMQQELQTKYNFTNFGSSALTSLNHSKYTYTGLENMISTFEDLDSLFKALELKDNARFMDIAKERLDWADAVIRESTWADWAGISGSSKKQNSFIWTLSEAYNVADTGLIYKVDNTKKAIKQNVSDVFGFRKQYNAKLGTYVNTAYDTLKNVPEYASTVKELKSSYKNLSYYMKELVEDTGSSKEIIRYKLLEPTEENKDIVNYLRTKLTGVDEKGLYKLTDQNKQIIESYSNLFEQQVFNTDIALKNINDIIYKVQDLKNADIKIPEDKYVGYTRIEKVSNDIIKSIGIQAHVLDYTDEQLQTLWGIINPQIPETYREDIGQYFLNSNKALPELDTTIKVKNYNEEKIVKAWLSLVSDNGNAKSVDYLKNIYSTKLDNNGTLRFSYDYTSDIVQSLKEIQAYLNNAQSSTKNLLEVGSVQHTKLENYATRQYLHEQNRGLQVLSQNNLVADVVRNIFNRDVPEINELYKGMNINDEDPIVDLLQELYFVWQGNINRQTMEREIKLSGLKAEDQKALFTVLDSTCDTDFYDIALKSGGPDAPTKVEAWKQDIKDSLKQYRGYTDLSYEKDNLVSLLHKHDIKFTTQDIETTTGKSSKLAELIDKLESDSNKEYQRKNIITMSVLNTQNKYGQPIDISFSVLDNDGKGVEIFRSSMNIHDVSGHSEAIADTERLANHYYPTYNKSKNYEDLYSKFKKDYMNKDVPEKDIPEVLTETFKFLSALSLSGKGLSTGEIPIYGFANKNDILALRSAYKNLHVPQEFNDLLDNIKFVDYLNEEIRADKNSAFNVLSIKDEQKVDEILEHIYLRALELQKIGDTVNKRVKMVGGLNLGSMQKLSNNIESPLVQAALIYADTDKGKYALSALSNLDNIFKIPTNLNGEVKTALYDTINKMVTDFANQTRNIDKTNSFFRQNFTDNGILNNEQLLKLVSEKLGLPINQTYNSMTQIYNAIESKNLLFGEQNYRSTIYSVLDMSKLKDVPKASVVPVSEVAQHIVDEMNRIKNPKILEPYHNDINKSIERIKQLAQDMYETGLINSNLFAYLRSDTMDVKHSWATLVQINSKLKDVLNNTPKITPEYEYCKKLYSVLENGNKDVINLLEDSTELYEKMINWDGTTNLDKFKMMAYTDLPAHLKWQVDLEEVSKLESGLESLVNRLNTAQNSHINNVISESINDVKTPLTELHNYLLEVKKLKPEELKKTMNITRQVKQFKESLFTSKVLQLPDDQLIKYLIANVPDRFFLVNIPKTGTEGSIVNYPEIYQNFIKRKKDLKDIGIKLQEHDDLLEVSLDYKMYKELIKPNKDYATKGSIKWTFNKEKVVPVQFQTLSTDEKNMLYTITQDQTTTDKLLQLFENFETLDPNLEGLTGDLHSQQFWKDFKHSTFAQDLQAKDWIKDRDDDDLGTLYNCWNLGTSGQRNSLVPTTPHELNILTGLANRLSKSHEEYADILDFFINNESDLSFNSDFLKDMPIQEINQFLKENTDYRILVPVRDKAFNRQKVNGGIALQSIDEVTKANRKALEQGGAMIVPSDIYSYLVNQVNNFTYGHESTAVAAKLLGKWKLRNIITVGAQFRNAVDTNLKTIGTSGSMSQTLANNTWAAVQIANYKQICMNIKKATGVLDDRGIDMYFDNNLPGTSRMTKEEFNIVDSFYRIKGEVIDADTTFVEKILAFTNYTEEVNRLGLYKTLRDQGYTNSRAWQNVSDTHFDYSTASKSAAYMKFIFPYWTYLTNQVRWFLDMFSSQPRLARLMIKTYENHWEQDDRFKNEYAFNNKTMLYTKFAGNFLDKNSNLTLKVGPSLFDSLHMMSDPVSEVVSKLSIPLQMVFNSLMQHTADNVLNKDNCNTYVKQYIRNNYATYDVKTKRTNTGIAWIDSLYDWIQVNSGNKGGGGEYSIQNTISGKYNLIETLAQMVPFLNSTLTTYSSAIKNFVRSGKYENLFLPTVFGAISEYSTKPSFIPKKYSYAARTYTPRPRKVYGKKTYGRKVYAKKSYARKSYAKKSYAKSFYAGTPGVNQGMTYTYSKGGIGYAKYMGYPSRSYVSGKRPYSKYETFMMNVARPNMVHRTISSQRSTNAQFIPQSFYSYGGLNKYGKSKALAWLRSKPKNRVKSTLKMAIRQHTY